MEDYILLAEDDENISEVMTIILKEEGYSVRTAPNRQEVERALSKHLPQLIFLDIRLGGQNGEEIARQLKSDKKTASLPLIIVTADDKIQEIASNVGADGFISKPFDMQELIELVHKHIA